jgi:hypothetical protein
VLDAYSNIIVGQRYVDQFVVLVLYMLMGGEFFSIGGPGKGMHSRCVWLFTNHYCHRVMQANICDIS